MKLTNIQFDLAKNQQHTVRDKRFCVLLSRLYIWKPKRVHRQRVKSIFVKRVESNWIHQSMWKPKRVDTQRVKSNCINWTFESSWGAFHVRQVWGCSFHHLSSSFTLFIYMIYSDDLFRWFIKIFVTVCLSMQIVHLDESSRWILCLFFIFISIQISLVNKLPKYLCVVLIICLILILAVLSLII